ncbi:microtubule nucleation factor SSNA1-like [Bacillus rossius redtenbacheri]|uniref:microtubule nucleation factor SSNA1-like n=1 Tax=Bacillus rossius redtenbacheri TaxID=93214 RepID=UPI002FDD9A11
MTENTQFINCYTELKKGLEDLQRQRDKLQCQIEKQHEEKALLQNQIEMLHAKLSLVNDSLVKNMATRNAYDKSIADAEAAYLKIVESSQVLLNMVRRESASLHQKVSKDFRHES